MDFSGIDEIKDLHKDEDVEDKTVMSGRSNVLKDVI